MTSPEVERKVRQLDNDVQSIYDLLSDLDSRLRTVQAGQLRQGSRLDQIEDRLSGIDGKLETQGARLDVQGAKLDAQGAKLDAQGAKLDAILDLLQGPAS